ncbi:MAG: hypothetical protein M1820_007714 [Bogoriella megaspora]|nr:MAG: hypothetical protein M1820_007714 [Bogoriella megaspora]
MPSGVPQPVQTPYFDTFENGINPAAPEIHPQAAPSGSSNPATSPVSGTRRRDPATSGAGGGVSSRHAASGGATGGPRKPREYTEAELGEQLPRNKEELKVVFDHMAEKAAAKKKGGIKYLSREKLGRVREYCRNEEARFGDPQEKHACLKTFRVDEEGKVFRKEGRKKGGKEDGLQVFAIEDWFKVFWDAHDALYHRGMRPKASRDQTMKEIKEGGVEPPPKDLIQAIINRCHHPDCRKGSSLANGKAKKAGTSPQHSAPASMAAQSSEGQQTPDVPITEGHEASMLHQRFAPGANSSSADDQMLGDVREVLETPGMWQWDEQQQEYVLVIS